MEKSAEVKYTIFFWSILICFIYNAISLMTNWDRQVTIKDLIWQLLFGHRYVINTAFWFLWDMLVMYIFFSALVLIQNGDKYKNNKNASRVENIFFLIIGLTALYMQYSGNNFKFFDDMCYEMKFTLGRMCEMIPYAVLGIVCGKVNIVKQMERYRTWIIIILNLIIIICFNVDVFVLPMGFGYQGIENIILSLSIVALFGLLPINNCGGVYICQN